MHEIAVLGENGANMITKRLTFLVNCFFIALVISKYMCKTFPHEIGNSYDLQLLMVSDRNLFIRDLNIKLLS